MALSKTKIAPQSLEAWLHASRPKTWPVAILPPAIGFLMGSHFIHEIHWGLALSFFAASIFLIIGMNLINDVFDFRRGADTISRIGHLKVAAHGLLSDKQLLKGGLICLAAVLVFSIPLIWSGGAAYALLVLVAVVCGYFYTPISYVGLSEFLIMAFYGFAATLSAYYLENRILTPESWVAGFQIGCFAVLMNALNNLRDIQDDKKGGKKTLAVRFGITFARCEIALLLFLPYLVSIYWYVHGQFFPFFLPMTTLLMAVNLARNIFRYDPSRIYNRFYGEAALLVLLFGTLFILGFRV
jgi:1,4-dihydroxy-2-naphthoate octaprenyltransferase